MREATAASTAWETAQSRNLVSIAARSAAKPWPGIGMIHPVRCPATASSAHSVIGGGEHYLALVGADGMPPVTVYSSGCSSLPFPPLSRRGIA